MSVNYSLLKESENEIMNEFQEFYNYIIKTNKELYGLLKQNHNSEKLISDEEFDQIQIMLNKTDILKSDLVSNCIWVIQKNEPRASHLRFIVAIIYSTKNLLSIANNTRVIVKFFNKTKITNEQFNIFLKLLKDTMELSQKIFNILFDKKITEKYKPLEENILSYHLAVKNIFRQYNNLEDEHEIQASKCIINFFINIGKLERIIDHQEDILRDFNYIR